MEPIDHTEDTDDNGEFFFESDHLALRGNADYTAVLRTLAVLQAQRVQATKDIDKIALIEREALEDPEAFVKKLSTGVDLGLPKSIAIAELPRINFEKYNVAFPEIPKEVSTNRYNSQDIVVRGRVFDQSKPETFNQLWTCEEQRRLEELLIEYPPEPIEMRRFAKIARALGNRTTKQVASRVQKFFKKLHSAGMPVPGRLPKSQRQYVARANRMHKHILRPSTFFPAHDVPVTMPEDDDWDEGTSFDQFTMQKSSGANSVSSYDKEQTYRNTGAVVVDAESEDDDQDSGKSTKDESRVLRLLQRVRKDKEKDTIDRPRSEHSGFECSDCLENPILGTRWHCNSCVNNSVDFCSDCFTNQLLSDKPHPVSHKFSGLRVYQNHDATMLQLEGDSDGEDQDYDNTMLSSNVYDKDYLPSRFSKPFEYNYLDPNFLPE